MYCRDLSPYRYMRHCTRRGVLNIGWLDSKHSYETGPIPTEVLDRLWKHLLLPVARSRGFHTCNLCPRSATQPFVVTRESTSFTLGWSEIRVIAESGSVFACPSLIWHYIDVHQYRPPETFVSALLGGLDPASAKFVDTLRSLDPDFVHPEELARYSKRGSRKSNQSKPKRVIPAL